MKHVAVPVRWRVGVARTAERERDDADGEREDRKSVV